MKWWQNIKKKHSKMILQFHYEFLLYFKNKMQKIYFIKQILSQFKQFRIKSQCFNNIQSLYFQISVNIVNLQNVQLLSFNYSQFHIALNLNALKTLGIDQQQQYMITKLLLGLFLVYIVHSIQTKSPQQLPIDYINEVECLTLISIRQTRSQIYNVNFNQNYTSQPKIWGIYKTIEFDSNKTWQRMVFSYQIEQLTLIGYKVVIRFDITKAITKFIWHYFAIDSNFPFPLFISSHWFNQTFTASGKQNSIELDSQTFAGTFPYDPDNSHFVTSFTYLNISNRYAWSELTINSAFRPDINMSSGSLYLRVESKNQLFFTFYSKIDLIYFAKSAHFGDKAYRLESKTVRMSPSTASTVVPFYDNTNFGTQPTYGKADRSTFGLFAAFFSTFKLGKICEFDLRWDFQVPDSGKAVNLTYQLNHLDTGNCSSIFQIEVEFLRIYSYGCTEAPYTYENWAVDIQPFDNIFAICLNQCDFLVDYVSKNPSLCEINSTSNKTTNNSSFTHSAAPIQLPLDFTYEVSSIVLISTPRAQTSTFFIPLMKTYNSLPMFWSSYKSLDFDPVVNWDGMCFAFMIVNISSTNINIKIIICGNKVVSKLTLHYIAVDQTFPFPFYLSKYSFKQTLIQTGQESGINLNYSTITGKFNYDPNNSHFVTSFTIFNITKPNYWNTISINSGFRSNNNSSGVLFLRVNQINGNQGIIKFSIICQITLIYFAKSAHFGDKAYRLESKTVRMSPSIVSTVVPFYDNTNFGTQPTYGKADKSTFGLFAAFFSTFKLGKICEFDLRWDFQVPDSGKAVNLTYQLNHLDTGNCSSIFQIEVEFLRIYSYGCTEAPYILANWIAQAQPFDHLSAICLNKCDFSYSYSQQNPKYCLQNETINETTICNKVICTKCNGTNDNPNCLECNTTNYFNLYPQEGLCTCITGFELISANNTISCKQICGDGILFPNNVNECDDGNTDSGDGCSDQCKIQPYFYCTNIYYNISVCFVNFTYTVTVQSFLKEETDNAFNVQLSVIKVTHRLLTDSTNLTNKYNITSNFPYKNMTITEISPQLINIRFEYADSLNEASQLTITYVSAAGMRTTVNLPETTDNNLSLKVYSQTEYQTFTLFMSLMPIFSYIVMALLILSFCFSSKLIAIEALLIYQFAFGGLITLKKLEPLMYTYRQMWIFNGYNYFWDDGVKVPPNFKTSFYNGQFFANFNFDIIIILFPLTIGSFFFIFNKISKNNYIQRLGKIILGEWQISALLFCIQQLVFALIISLRYGNQKVLGGIIGIALLLLYLTYIVIILIKYSKMTNRNNPMGQFRSMMKKQIKRSNFNQNFYAIVMTYRLLLNLALILLSQSIGSGIAILLISISYTTILIWKKPYKQNIRPIINSSAILLLSIFFLYCRHQTDSSGINFATYLPIFIIIVLGLLGIMNVSLAGVYAYKLNKNSKNNKNKDCQIPQISNINRAEDTKTVEQLPVDTISYELSSGIGNQPHFDSIIHNFKTQQTDENFNELHITQEKGSRTISKDKIQLHTYYKQKNSSQNNENSQQ